MPDNYEEIVGDAPTLRMLERIRQNRGLIQVFIKERPKPWSSTIINVDTTNNVWQFDELPTEEGHRLLLKEKRCYIETRLNGVLIKFNTEIIKDNVDKNGIIYYTAQPPRSIRVYQRRSNFRVPVPANQSVILNFHIPGLPQIRGRIHDISLGGLGVILNSYSPLIDTGVYITNSTIVLPDNKLINCELKICFVRRSYNGILIGMRFEKITKEDQRKISQFVNFLDRERAKRERFKDF